MITIFNRKELLATYDQRQVNDLRECLLTNGIDYQVKVSYARSPFSMSAGRTHSSYYGSVRQQEQYTVYVSKKDYDHALYLLRECR